MLQMQPTLSPYMVSQAVIVKGNQGQSLQN